MAQNGAWLAKGWWLERRESFACLHDSGIWFLLRLGSTLGCATKNQLRFTQMIDDWSERLVNGATLTRTKGQTKTFWLKKLDLTADDGGDGK